MKCGIITEDESILVCFKPVGLAVQSGRIGEADMVNELKNHLADGKGEPYLGVVHRLDQPVSGLLVFGKTPEAAARLSRQAAGMTVPMEKEYTALLYPEEPGRLPREGETLVLEDHLLKDGRQNLSRVVGKDVKGAKPARMELVVLERGSASEREKHVAARIRLMTGRHHQIRVQCAAAGLPLLGDARYGSPASREYSSRLGISSVCLCASGLRFSHPVTGERMEYRVEELPWKI